MGFFAALASPIHVPDDGEIAAMGPLRLRTERTRLRNEVSFAFSEAACGGPNRDAFKDNCNRAIAAISARIATAKENN